MAGNIGQGMNYGGMSNPYGRTPSWGGNSVMGGNYNQNFRQSPSFTPPQQFGLNTPYRQPQGFSNMPLIQPGGGLPPGVTPRVPGTQPTAGVGLPPGVKANPREVYYA